MKRTPIISILRDSRGTTIIEYAVVAPVFFLIFFAMFEFGLITYTQIALNTAVAEAGREMSIAPTKGPGFDPVTAFKNEVTKRTAGLINSNHVEVAANLIGSGGTGGTDSPDLCLLPGQPPSTPSTCPSGTAFVDSNGNGAYDVPSTPSLGSSGDEVELRVSLPWQIHFPFLKSFFKSKDNNGNTVEGTMLLSATTVIKNE